MTQPIPLTLATIADGAAEELFARELARVVDNIADVNCDPTKPRTITLTISLAADEERKKGEAVVSCTSRLVGVKPASTPLYYGRDQGRFTVVESPVRQNELFTNPEARPRVVTPAATGGPA